MLFTGTRICTARRWAIGDCVGNPPDGRGLEVREGRKPFHWNCT